MNEILSKNTAEELMVLFVCVAEKSFGNDLNKEAARLQWIEAIRRAYKLRKEKEKL